MSVASLDPYYGTTVLGWFSTLVVRLCAVFPNELYEDELQLFVLLPFACAASFLGVFLVLKRLTMLTNALSHTMLLGIVIAIVLGSVGKSVVDVFVVPDSLIILSSVVVGLITAFLTQQLGSVRGIREDASNAMVFSALFALAVVILSLWTRDAHIGPELLMGTPDALSSSDLPLVWIVAVMALGVGAVCARGFALAIFDQEFALMVQARPVLFLHVLLGLVAVTSISAFRAVGFVMTLAFFTIPPLIAQLWTTTLWGRLLCSSAIGMATAFVSVACSRHLLTVWFLPVSTSALAVVMLALIYTTLIVQKSFRLIRVRSNILEHSSVDR